MTPGSFDGAITVLFLAGFVLPSLGAILALLSGRWFWFWLAVALPCVMICLLAAAIALHPDSSTWGGYYSPVQTLFLATWPFGAGLAGAALILGVAALLRARRG